MSLLLVLLTCQLSHATESIDPLSSYMWSKNTGWINLRSNYGGISVQEDHFSGYAWGENIGWISFGSESGGPYANTSADDWGVNINPDGILSGHAWSHSAGWINFNVQPVTFNRDTGFFHGYAWGRNIGWICTDNLQTEYGLVAYYPFDEDAKDYSGNGHDGTVTGAVPVSDRLGRVFEFDGVDDAVEIPSLDWTPTTFTIEWWHYPLSHNDSNQRLKATSEWSGFTFHTTSTGAVYVGTDYNTAFTSANLPADTLELNQWQHFAFTFRNGDAAFYKDGTLLARKTGMTHPVAWGGFNFTTEVHGRIDEARIYDRALEDAEVLEHYRRHSPGEYVQWKTEDGGNGHWYGIVKYNGTWAQAKAHSEQQFWKGSQGHLCTVTSPDENDFILGNLSKSQSAWLGGYQVDKTAEPAGNWEWVTGEAWDYLCWNDGAPNDAGNIEDYLQYNSGFSSWNDVSSLNVLPRYVMEFSLHPFIDSDGDGIDDNWEMEHFGNLTTVNEMSDADGDGISDLEEFRIGSDPNEHFLTDQLVASYPFNGNADDESGNENHGTVDGVVLTTDKLQRPNNAYGFDGIDDHIDMPGLDWTPTAFTIEWWHYPLSRKDSNQRLKATSDWNGFTFHTTSTGEIWVGTNYNTAFSPTDLLPIPWN